MAPRNHLTKSFAWYDQFEIIQKKSNPSCSAREIRQHFDCAETDLQAVLKRRNCLRRWWFRFEKTDSVLLRVRPDVELNQHIFEWMIEKRAKVDPKKGCCRYVMQMIASRLGLHPPRSGLDCYMGFKRSHDELKYMQAVNMCLDRLVRSPEVPNDSMKVETKEDQKKKMFFVVMPTDAEIKGEKDDLIKSILMKLKGIKEYTTKKGNKQINHSDMLANCTHWAVKTFKTKFQKQYEAVSVFSDLESTIYDNNLYSTDTEIDSDEVDSDDELCIRLMASLYMPPNEHETWGWIKKTEDSFDGESTPMDSAVGEPIMLADIQGTTNESIPDADSSQTSSPNSYKTSDDDSSPNFFILSSAEDNSQTSTSQSTADDLPIEDVDKADKDNEQRRKRLMQHTNDEQAEKLRKIEAN